MLVDAHAHLDRYGDDEIEEVLAAIERQGILTLSVAEDPVSFARAEAIATRSTLVVGGFGSHPSVAHEFVTSMREGRKTADRSPYIGEIGLDYRFVTDAIAMAPNGKCLRRCSISPGTRASWSMFIVQEPSGIRRTCVVLTASNGR